MKSNVLAFPILYLYNNLVLLFGQFLKPITYPPKVVGMFSTIWGCKLVLQDEVNVLNSTGQLVNSKRTLILFTNPSARAGYDTRSIFKRSSKRTLIRKHKWWYSIYRFGLISNLLIR